MKHTGYDFPVRENDFREEDFYILTVFGNIKIEHMDKDFQENLPLVIEKCQVKYSEKGFASKLAKVARKAGLKVVYATLLLHYALNSPQISTKDKSIIYGALGYFIFPMDFISDFLPFAGYTDDFAALAWAISKVVRNITPEVKMAAREKVSQWFTLSEGDRSLFEKIEKGK
jgi:uncharacterized membrane protein YkvA (DUF1232 family)